MVKGDTDRVTAATREEMSAARVPLAYRDSCAHLLIPLNKCRYEEYYLPWKCEVRLKQDTGAGTCAHQPSTDRETLVREMPIRRVQAAGSEDGRAESGQGRRPEQLDSRWF